MPKNSMSYHLHWEGRQEAEQEVDTPTSFRWQTTPSESTPSEQTTHLFVEGDNLDALKLLQNEYQNRVKIIYIDPPYNTGQTMSYQDNYRFHAEWLSMMYPRLTLARKLLSQDGAIFVSIDDNEYHNLRYLMDEIYGPDNFIANVIWRKKVVRGRGAAHIIPQTEYILMYARSLEHLPAFSEPITEKMRKEYRFSDEHGPYKRIPLAKSGTSHSPRPNLVYPIEAPDGTMIPCPTHQWRWSKETLERKKDQIEFVKGRDKRWRVFTKQYLYIDGEARRKTPTSYYDNYTTTHGTQDMKALFGEVVLDFPKPVGLLQDLLVWMTGTNPNNQDIVLDFFAGSGTTGEAVLRLNQADGGDRRFILVQIPAPPPPKSAAARAGFSTIANLCKDRIQRVLLELKEQSPHEAQPGLDVVKLVESKPKTSQHNQQNSADSS